MAGGILRQWFRKPKAKQPDIAEAIAELDRAARRRPSLEGSLKLLRTLLPTLYDDIPAVPTFAIDADQAQAKLSGGVPLLRGERLNLNDTVHDRRWRSVCEAAGASGLGALGPTHLIQEVLAGRPEAVSAQAEELGLDGGQATTVLRLYWFPILSEMQATLSCHRAGAPWEHGYCPVCGSGPLVAELRGLEQGRHLRCGLCAASWELFRLQCPFCGSRDHRDLGYFQVAGEETRFRVSTCDACRRYLKTVSTLSELAGPSLLAADAMTLHLDLAAAERGYLV